MKRFLSRLARLSFVLPVAVISLQFPALSPGTDSALAAEEPVSFVVEQVEGSQFIYVVFHALDRDGFCQPPTGAVSLHPVLKLPIDFVIEAGDGIIIDSSSGTAPFGRSAEDIPTFSTAVNATSAAPVRSFPPLVDGLTDECQAWIKVSQSIPGPLRVLVTAPGDDGGTVGFEADLSRPESTSVTLNFRWSLVTWNGTDGMSPANALKSSGGAADITGSVSALYGWDGATQTWKGYFPSGAGVPGANDLTGLRAGSAYWIAVNGPGSVSWQVTPAS